MANNAFTAGVKPGGLNNSAEIRILLCYLIQNVPEPLSQEEIERALLGEELVNYFELASALSQLCDRGLAKLDNGRYHILPPGEEVARSLSKQVPYSVRETAIRAAVTAQQFARKAAQHKAQITPSGEGYMVRCYIEDAGGEIFSCSLSVPNLESAEMIRSRFIDKGEEIFGQMLHALAGV